MAIATADIHVKVDPEIKERSETVLNQIGISMSDLVNMTLRRVIYERDIPFKTSLADAKIPESMDIKTEEELLAFLDHTVEANQKSSEKYTVDEVRQKTKEGSA